MLYCYQVYLKEACTVAPAERRLATRSSIVVLCVFSFSAAAGVAVLDIDGLSVIDHGNGCQYRTDCEN